MNDLAWAIIDFIRDTFEYQNVPGRFRSISFPLANQAAIFEI